jgi:hypothetical protein
VFNIIEKGTKMEELKTREEILKVILQIDEEISRLNVFRSEMTQKMFDIPITEEEKEKNRKWLEQLIGKSE